MHYIGVECEHKQYHGPYSCCLAVLLQVLERNKIQMMLANLASSFYIYIYIYIYIYERNKIQ